MSKNKTRAQIWLPNDEETIKVQNLIFKGMDKSINQVSKKLGATVKITSYSPTMNGNRYVLYSTNNKGTAHSYIQFYNSQSSPTLYEEYSDEHPIIKVLLDSFYNGRISYYKLCECLAAFPDINISDLTPYYTSITFKDYNIASISSIQKSMTQDIEETAHGYDPADTLLLRNYRHELVRRGEWMPSHGGIIEEAKTNEFILKRVFKRKY